MSASACAPFGTHGAQSSPDAARSSRWAMVPVDCRISIWRHASRQTAKRRSRTFPVAIGREYITGYLVYGTDFPSLLVEFVRPLTRKPLRNTPLRTWPGDRTALWM